MKSLLKEASRELGAECVPRPARESSRADWQKADAYYFCNIARLKRIWQVCTLFCTLFLQCKYTRCLHEQAS